MKDKVNMYHTRHLSGAVMLLFGFLLQWASSANITPGSYKAADDFGSKPAPAKLGNRDEFDPCLEKFWLHRHAGLAASDGTGPFPPSCEARGVWKFFKNRLLRKIREKRKSKRQASSSTERTVPPTTAPSSGNQPAPATNNDTGTRDKNDGGSNAQPADFDSTTLHKGANKLVSRVPDLLVDNNLRDGGLDIVQGAPKVPTASSDGEGPGPKPLEIDSADTHERVEDFQPELGKDGGVKATAPREESGAAAVASRVEEADAESEVVGQLAFLSAAPEDAEPMQSSTVDPTSAGADAAAAAIHANAAAEAEADSATTAATAAAPAPPAVAGTPVDGFGQVATESGEAAPTNALVHIDLSQPASYAQAVGDSDQESITSHKSTPEEPIDSPWALADGRQGDREPSYRELPAEDAAITTSEASEHVPSLEPQSLAEDPCVSGGHFDTSGLPPQATTDGSPAVANTPDEFQAASTTSRVEQGVHDAITSTSTPLEPSTEEVAGIDAGPAAATIGSLARGHEEVSSEAASRHQDEETPLKSQENGTVAVAAGVDEAEQEAGSNDPLPRTSAAGKQPTPMEDDTATRETSEDASLVAPPTCPVDDGQLLFFSRCVADTEDHPTSDGTDDVAASLGASDTDPHSAAGTETVARDGGIVGEVRHTLTAVPPGNALIDSVIAETVSDVQAAADGHQVSITPDGSTAEEVIDPPDMHDDGGELDRELCSEESRPKDSAPAASEAYEVCASSE